MKKFIYIFCILGLMLSCADGITDINVDQKNPSTVPASTLVANSTVSLFNLMTSPSVNVNNFRLWAQHWAQVSYNDESNYELVERNVNGGTFNRVYATVLRDLSEARKFVDADVNLTDEVKASQFAIIDVMKVVSYTILVDIFGDVPYSAALGEDVTPTYDDDKDVYYAMIDLLDSAIGNLSGSAGNIGDLVYGGDASAWKKFANSYKLRLAIRIADVDEGKAKSMAESAVSSGVFESSADNFQLQYEGSTPNTNPLWVTLVQSGRSDYISANTFVDVLNELDDPRRAGFFMDNVKDANDEVIYVGGIYGDVNSYTAHSQVGSKMLEPTLPGAIMDYTEVLFLLADAAQRGFNVGGSAEDFYNMGITASILDWGGTEEAAAAYIDQERVDYDSDNWRESIGTQKWIAMYNRGFEAWTTWRIYDAPEMNLAVAAGTVPPSRYTYPVNEYSVNKENVEAAAAKMDNDDPFAKVFWDAN